MPEKQTLATDRKISARQLMELAANDGRGKLKVFLGMAPGVGKTFTMLSTARALKTQGTDVVVGLVETHGRSETANLLEGLEVLPRKPVPYRNRTLMEFDVDAAIARRPKLLLVDEFAHSNAPGLVHAKRYQDVEGVLQAGIDVWTTLNIQHLESLNDAVARITGITVHETVPDRILEKADEIVIVDLPPEELIQRLKDGKVYLPDNAQRAIDKFFKPSNLTALRELALRRTADRVDEKMLTQLREHGIQGPWPASDRLLVCVLGDEGSEAVVRNASRMAKAQKCDWIALNLARGDRETMERSIQKRSDKAMRLAERLGATSTRLNAKDLVKDTLAYAKRNNITQIVVGRTPGSRYVNWLKPSFAEQLAAQARDIAVTQVASEGEKKDIGFLKPFTPSLGTTGAVAAIVAVGFAVALGAVIERLAPIPNLSMVFLLAILICATRFGVWPAVLASALSFIAYNFFFIDPRYTLTVAQPYEFLSLLMFLVVAIATGGLAGRLHEQADATRERAEATQALYEFSRKLAGAAGIDDVLWLLAAQSATSIKGRSTILLQRDEALAIVGGWPPDDDLSTSDWAAARWSYEKNEPAGRGTGTMPPAHFQFRPLSSTKGPLGVVGFAPDDDEDAPSSAAEGAIQSFIDQAAVAIERTLLVDQAAKAETSAEAERLRASLLSSVSHDLKTPLASIVGSVTSLRQLGAKMPKRDQDDLLATIEEEAERLSLFVSNLLDMTKIEAGALDIRRETIDIGDALRDAVDRARAHSPARTIEISVDENLPHVRGDSVLIQQVFFNLLDNANKYSDPQSVTRVIASREQNSVSVTIADSGIGIPPEALKKVFAKFFRVAGSDGRSAGTGLGLSIAAGIVEAMGGTIYAESPIEEHKGTRIIVSLPAGSVPHQKVQDRISLS